MPKEAKPDHIWREELAAYAISKKLKPGSHPRRESKWGKEKAKIDDCPAFQGAATDVFGRPIKCNCGYQHKKSYPKRMSASSTAPKLLSSPPVTLPNHFPTVNIQSQSPKQLSSTLLKRSFKHASPNSYPPFHKPKLTPVPEAV
uniref:Uncharacterized protein n=1 Tax=Clytia hemisphaerica TaxID=252671 RepID=A0A7M5WVF8_9CNID